MKIHQACKLMVAACIGYSLSFLTIQLPSDDCTHKGIRDENRINKMKLCPVCECKTSLKEINTDFGSPDFVGYKKLRKSFRPKSMYEVIQYDYFSKKSMYNSFYEEPRHGLLRHEKSDIAETVKQVMNEVIQRNAKNKWKFKRVINGYRRLDPLRGEEFVLDLELMSNNLSTQLIHIDAVKPVYDIKIVKASLTKKLKINFILPIASVGNRFKKFMDHFEQYCLKTNEEVALRIVLFSAEDVASSENVKNIISTLKIKYSRSDLTVLETNKTFSRGAGLHLGVEHMNENSLVYFCDVDVLFTPEFLTRCRNNALKHEQVYYPIVFAQYEPTVVQTYSPQHKYKDLMDITKYTGHWVHYAYGMVCMYKSDYTAVGGFDLNRQGWGGEDVELFTKHARSPLNVFRAMDPGLIHIFHPKVCDTSLSKNQYEMCIQSAAESLGSRQQLGKLLLADYSNFLTILEKKNLPKM